MVTCRNVAWVAINLVRFPSSPACGPAHGDRRRNRPRNSVCAHCAGRPSSWPRWPDPRTGGCSERRKILVRGKPTCHGGGAVAQLQAKGKGPIRENIFCEYLVARGGIEDAVPFIQRAAFVAFRHPVAIGLAPGAMRQRLYRISPARPRQKSLMPLRAQAAKAPDAGPHNSRAIRKIRGRILGMDCS